jgi:hypothetical protein
MSYAGTFCLVGVCCVSELVQTLWFEDTSFLNEQMLDTPVGRFSIRQMGIFLIFGLLSWVTSLAFTDLVLKIVVAGAIFFAGAAIFTRKIKTVSPEAHLLYLVRKQSLQIKQKHPASKGKQPVEQTSKSMLLSATLGATVKVVNVLKDTTGKILPNKNFKVNINNTPHIKGTTDTEGNFCTYFTPDHLGLFELTIQPEDALDVLQQITIQVNPKTQEEATQNAKTKTTP